jgi:transcriptional regulator with XRE-family HTH domain
VSRRDFQSPATLSRIDVTYISDIERGLRNVSLKSIKVLTESLGVSLSELFKGL